MMQTDSGVPSRALFVIMSYFGKKLPLGFDLGFLFCLCSGLREDESVVAACFSIARECFEESRVSSTSPLLRRLCWLDFHAIMS